MGSSIILSGLERVGVLDPGIKLTEAVVPEWMRRTIRIGLRYRFR